MVWNFFFPPLVEEECGNLHVAFDTLGETYYGIEIQYKEKSSHISLMYERESYFQHSTGLILLNLSLSLRSKRNLWLLFGKEFTHKWILWNIITRKNYWKYGRRRDNNLYHLSMHGFGQWGHFCHQSNAARLCQQRSFQNQLQELYLITIFRKDLHWIQ